MCDSAVFFFIYAHSWLDIIFSFTIKYSINLHSGIVKLIIELFQKDVFVYLKSKIVAFIKFVETILKYTWQ